MNKTRMEAFSDGVIAIIITIMVLELKVPHDPTGAALLKLTPVFLSYVLSFVIVAIYWVNHHHLVHVAHKASAPVLWSNIHLLFWLSLLPFVTGYMGENHSTPLSVATYGFVATACGAAFHLLRAMIQRDMRRELPPRELSAGEALKGYVAVGIYASSVPLAFVSIYLAYLCLVIPALMYFIPDDRKVEQLGA
jgi:uncharacterized membrane protein